MRVLSIDPGTRNLGWCVWDTMANTVVDFGVVDLQKVCKGTDYPKKIWALTQTDFFNSADVILVERQMQSRMKMLACAIRCFYWDKTIMIAPQSVRRHFKTMMKKHSSNKKAHVAHARKFLQGTLLHKFEQHKKKDDISDAIMQVLYYKSSSE
tara:strand:- start:2809 stop:3267 length:459 start_codon:yes stop_codon:yes gene_type:complete